jgi:hypothetical protein
MWFACIRLGGVALFQEELACVQEELFVVFELWIRGLCSLLEHVSLGCVEPLPIPKGSETWLLQVILLFAIPLAFNRLLEFFSRFFSFPFLFGYQNVCVVNASIKWEIERLCGSRIGGRSLPGVMSDWQRGVDWFLAKYCRCRLRLDWCWCGWGTSAKGRCWWGLQVWRRQVGLIRGTRWLAESSAGRMVARTARWSHGQFLDWASKPRSSRDYVGAESWVVIGGGYTEFAGYPVVNQKTTGFIGWSTKPRPKTEVQ